MDRNELAGAMAAFLANGGKVHQVEGFTGTAPHRQRREIKQSPKPMKRKRGMPKKHKMSIEEELVLVDQIKQAAAEGATQQATYQALGISQTLFVALCFENRIKFIAPADARQTANKQKAIDCRAKRDELAPKVAEYAHLGMKACAALLKVSDGHVRRIARENGIAMKGGQ